MGDQYYRRFPGDYARDTGHLSLAEHGAYSLLLDHYYATGRPLEDDLDALYRICGAIEKSEKNAVKKVAFLFFPVNGDNLRHNKRADKELQQRQAYSEKQSMRAHMRWHMQTHMRRECPPSPSPAPAKEKRKTTSCSSTTKPADERDDVFASFWQAYPRKIAKGSAVRAWAKIKRPAETLALILRALAWQTVSDQWTRDNCKYIPYPATYLNARRWEDVPEEQKPSGLRAWAESRKEKP